ncbi:MAG: metal transporter [Deltaproteobacteria bacterium]|nr:metal transporter [Deltaproteobacteria bacterium]
MTDQKLGLPGELLKDFFEGASFEPQVLDKYAETNQKIIEATLDYFKANQGMTNGVMRYLNDFMTPYWISLASFIAVERVKSWRTPPWETWRDYLELLMFNFQVADKGGSSSLAAVNEYTLKEIENVFWAWMNTIFPRNGHNLADYIARRRNIVYNLVYGLPQSILDIKPEYGFHFEEPGYILAAETDRFWLYQVLPTDDHVQVREHGKPIIILPPYVLGANILCFLPKQNKSYVHAYANHGIPTYVRIIKDIDTTPAVQTMTGEDDALDLRDFCETVKAKHDRPVTLNGFCQGGFVAVADLLSGELDGLVDALITCVSPMDGTRSIALVEYLGHLPARFRDLGYATKTLPNGNQVVDGKVMSWVYKLKSMDKEAPVFTFFRDLKMFDLPDCETVQVNKTAAAINYWLTYDRNDLPVSITKMSFDSYTIPVTKDGTLPVRLFNRPLNFKRLAEKGIKWLICCADKDDLVDRASALAPLDFVEAEVSVFPKGHGAIATSWSDPDTSCSLNKTFGGNCRGPVVFQLDLERKLDAEAKPAVSPDPEPNPTNQANSRPQEVAVAGPPSVEPVPNPPTAMDQAGAPKAGSPVPLVNRTDNQITIRMEYQTDSQTQKVAATAPAMDQMPAWPTSMVPAEEPGVSCAIAPADAMATKSTGAKTSGKPGKDKSAKAKSGK